MSGNTRRIAAQRTARLGGQALELGASVLEQVAASERAEYLALRARLAPLPPVAERGKMTEAHWQKQVVGLARALQFYVYHPHLSKFSERGWPDLSLLGGRALWIECKTDDGQLTEKQAEVMARMLRCGLEVHVFRPWHTLEQVAAVLQHGPLAIARVER